MGLAGEVARLFFDRQLTKVEIAQRIGISRFRVARLIDEAVEIGLVRIEFRNASPVDQALAREIESRFGLDLCVIAGDGPADANGAVADLAGSILGEMIGPGDTVGIAWGSTLARVVAAVPLRDESSITVVQLAGGSTRLQADRDAGEIARTLASRIGAAHHRLFAPTFVASVGLRDALLREPEVAATFGLFERLTLAIVGIGAIREVNDLTGSSLLASGVLAPDDIADLLARGAVGDLVVHPFAADGRFVAPELEARALAIDLAALRRIPRVIAVAAGRSKAIAIRGALQTGLLRALVTDSAAATAILRDTVASSPGSRGAARP